MKKMEETMVKTSHFWQIMSAPSMITIATVMATTPRQAIQEAINERKLVAETWRTFSVKDDFRIILY